MCFFIAFSRELTITASYKEFSSNPCVHVCVGWLLWKTHYISAAAATASTDSAPSLAFHAYIPRRLRQRRIKAKVLNISGGGGDGGVRVSILFIGGKYSLITSVNAVIERGTFNCTTVS